MNMEFGSVLNRLRDTVSATVYQVTSNLSTALPGNPLTREYELVRQVGSAGPGLIWKIYDATKKSTKESAGLWILEKKILDTRLTNKKDKEAFLDFIRKGVGQLTRLRHPSMLTVQHNIEESRDLIAFATEPVVGSLINFFDDDQKSLNTDKIASDKVSDKGADKEPAKEPFYDVEIKYGLLQISEGLLFLHKDAKILHRNICPENIIVNRNGIWKIAGFDFSVPTLNPNETPIRFSSLKTLPDSSPDVQANFTYSSPENFTSSSSSVTASSDVFSFGMLAYTLYNKGNPLCPFTTSHLYNSHKFVDELESKLASSSWLVNIPDDFKKHIRLLLSVDPNLRPDAQQIAKLAMFEDILVKTLQYFDSLFQWDNQQKSQFYKNLPEVLSKIPKRVQLRRIVNGLAKEFVNPEMVPFVLPNMIQIAKETNDEEFHTWILPELVTVFKYKEPIQIGIYLLQNMDFLVMKFKSKPESIKEHILPLIYRFLESDAYQIQEITLGVIPSVIHLIDYSSAKNMLLPRIKKLSLHTTILSVRVNSLICLGKIVESLDKWLVMDEILTLVMNIPSKEPAVIMSTVGILKLILNSNKLGIAKDLLAQRVIPFLVPLSIENGLTLQQYNTIMALIREMLCKVEEEHQGKLRQLDSIKVQQDNFLHNQTPVPVSASQSSNIFDGFQSAPVKSDSSSTPTGGLKDLGFLSLDDKERLSNEKEQLKRMNNEAPLQPQMMNNGNNVNRQTVEKPKDLTSSLINSNLNMLNNSSSNSNRYSAFQNQSIQSSSMSTSHSQPNFAVFQQQNQPSQPFAQYSQPQQTQQPVNMAALDSIMLPGSFNKPNTQTMNALKSQQPMSNYPNYNNSMQSSIPIKPNYNLNLNSTTSTSSASSKTLSKSELDEFLN